MRSLPLFLLSLALSLLFVSSAQAATIISGDLIKGSGPSVYYYGQNQKRYVFPNEKTFRTWYNDFSSVKTITDAELAAIAIGGNVTYRPAVRLVKVTTDPKVYAVAKDGVLRWVPDEATAHSLYGNDWARYVDDLPDAFFVNYQVADQVSSSRPFVIQTELSLAPDINTDKRLGPIIDPLPPQNSSPSTTPSTPLPTPISTSTPTIPPSSPTHPYPNTPGYSGQISLFNTTSPVPAGSRFNVFASASPSGGIQSIQIFQNNVLSGNCTDSPCSIPLTNNATSSGQIELRATFHWLGGPTAHATTSMQVTENTGNPLVRVTAATELLPTQNQTIRIVTNEFFNVAVTRIYIDGVNVSQCGALQTCEYSFRESAVIGSRSVYAILENGAGGIIQSPTITYQVVTNAHPTLRVIPSQLSLGRGEVLSIEVQGFDNDGIALTEILLDGTVLRSCNASSCQVTAGPWTQARTLQFTGHAQDISGLHGYASSTNLVTVQ